MMKKGFSRVFALVMFVAALATIAPAQNTYRDATSGFAKEITFLPSAARTVTNATAAPTDVGAYDTTTILINVTAVSGTSPTLVVNFDNCLDSTTTKCGLFQATASITATGLYVVKANQFARFGRISYTIGGTTPSFTFEVYAFFKPST